MKRTILACFMGVVFGSIALADQGLNADPPAELGRIQWDRDFDHAIAQAKQTDKPVLVLFDEVPGCSTCVNFGSLVLSHPLIVEAAQTHFVPVAVYNNIEGRDREVLLSFDEPTWNNPVVRIIGADRQERTPRHAGDYSVAGLAHAMATALEKTGKEVPAYLRLLAEESAGNADLQQATFAMHCFWDGEARLGALDGVAHTRTGWLDEREVVELFFNPAIIDYEQLVEEAQSMDCADRVYARTDQQRSAANAVAEHAVVRTDEAIRPTPKDDKWHLAKTAWRHVPMTETQAARANAAIAAGKSPDWFFSSAQRRLFDIVNSKTTDPDADLPNSIGIEMSAALEDLTQHIGSELDPEILALVGLD